MSWSFVKIVKLICSAYFRIKSILASLTILLIINSGNKKCLQSLYFPVDNWEIQLATLWKMELQHYGKITCNFQEKVLAKNIVSRIQEITENKNYLKDPVKFSDVVAYKDQLDKLVYELYDCSNEDIIQAEKMWG